MSLNRTHVPLLVFAMLSLGLGIVYGVQTDRWQASDSLDEAVAKLNEIPSEFNNWKGADLPVEPGELKRAGIKGVMFRRFKNSQTGTSVNVLIVCGKGGPISVHTPDICYAAAGFQPVSDPALKPITLSTTGEKMAFWTMQVSKPDAAVPQKMEVYWAWIRNGALESPQNSRFAYARTSALYKVYVARELSASSRTTIDNPCEDFIRDVVPEIQSRLAN